eukprot:ANDGO_02776.mRNA.1 hypothetical protein
MPLCYLPRIQNQQTVGGQKRLRSIPGRQLLTRNPQRQCSSADTGTVVRCEDGYNASMGFPPNTSFYDFCMECMQHVCELAYPAWCLVISAKHSAQYVLP